VTTPQCHFVAVAIGRYDDEASWPHLEEITEKAEQLARAMTGPFHRELPELSNSPSRELLRRMNEWRKHINPNDRVFVYWAGHGHPRDGNHFLVARDSSGKADLVSSEDFTAGQLAELLAQCRAEKVLVVLDTCYSGAGAFEAAQQILQSLQYRSQEPGQQRKISVLASTNAVDVTYAGEFSQALYRVMCTPVAKRDWGDHTEFLTPDEVASAIVALLEDSQLQPVLTEHGTGARWIPNPRFRPSLPSEDVETQQLRVQRFVREQAEDHLMWSARGVEVGQRGWLFTGRHTILIKLSDWLRRGDGIVVVTGSPGSGKSAVVGRLVTLSTPALRQLAEADGSLEGVPPESLPPEGAVDVAVHAKGKDLKAVMEAVGRVLPMELPIGSWTQDSFIGAVSAVETPLTVVIDALDEAASGEATPIAALCSELATAGLARVLLTSRYSPTRQPVGADEHQELHRIFGGDVVIYDLSQVESEEQTKRDIAEYSKRRLVQAESQAGGHSFTEQEAAALGHQIADSAAGVFLYSRIVSRTLRDQPELAGSELPADAVAAFRRDFIRFGERQQLVDDFYRALGWANGGGLTLKVWLPVANALADTTYRRSDMDWVLANAGWLITQAGEPTESGNVTVYRLYHESFADFYQRDEERAAAHRKIVAALLSTAPEDEKTLWVDVDPYVKKFLAVHAAEAAMIGEIVERPGYLVCAEPEGLLTALLSAPIRGEYGAYAAIYQLAAHIVRSTKDPAQRSSYLEMVSRQYHAEDVAVALGRVEIDRSWRAGWALWRRPIPHQAIPAGRIIGLITGAYDDQPLLVTLSSSRDEDIFTIRVWDPDKGSLYGPPVGFKGDPKELGISTNHGRVAIVVRFGLVKREADLRGWDVWNGTEITPLPPELIEDAFGSVSGDIAAGIVAQESVKARLDRDTVRFVGMESGQELLPRLKLPGEDNDPYSGMMMYFEGREPFGCGAVAGRPVVAWSSGGSGLVKTWFADDGRPAFATCSHGAQVLDLAITATRRGATVISTGIDEMVRIWDLQPLGDEGTEVYGVSAAVAVVDDRVTSVVVMSDGSIGLRDVRSGGIIRELAATTGSKFSRLAAAWDGGELTVAAWSKRRVVVFDTAGAVVSTLPVERFSEACLAAAYIGARSIITLPGRDDVAVWANDGNLIGRLYHSPVFAVAAGLLGDNCVIATGGEDGAVRLWSAINCEPLGLPLQHVDGGGAPVYDVAFGEADGIPVVVSSGYDQMVKVWNFETRELIRAYNFSSHPYAITVGRLHDSPVVAVGEENGTVTIHDLRAESTTKIAVGEQIGEVQLAPPDGLLVAVPSGILGFEIARRLA
jgi:WD40 repeat protein